jgi:uncharacterized protein (TIGR00661 family)
VIRWLAGMASGPNPRRPVLLYTLASEGMAHATRAVPMLERLGESFEVHVFCGGPAYKWLRAKFPHVHWIRRFKAVYIGDRVSIPLVMAKAVLTLPLSILSVARIGWHIVRHRPSALISDFEAIGVYTALLLRPLVKTKIVAFDNFCAARVAEPPFTPNAHEAKLLARWKRTLRAAVPFADTFLVQSVVSPPLTNPRARFVPPPIRDVFLRYDGELRTDGPIVVCLGGTRGFEWLPEVLRASGLAFHVYGAWEPKDDGLVSYRRFEDAAYLQSLANAPFSIVRGISSAFDALVLKKPIILAPARGQFEHWYNGRMFESLGVGRLVENLTAPAIQEFVRDIASYRDRVADVKFFDNEKVFEELARAVRAA